MTKNYTFANKLLKKISGPIQENGYWRIRKNQELRTLYKDPDIVYVIESQRIRWLGHILHKDPTHLLHASL